jgi:hypothetical protein
LNARGSADDPWQVWPAPGSCNSWEARGSVAQQSDRLAQLVRNDQDLAAEAQALDKTIIVAASKEPSKRDAAA